MRHQFLIYIFGTLLSVFYLSGVSAAPHDSLVIKGNQAYNEGLYQESTDYYLRVIEQGYESAELYFNIGNSYFKINRMPEAILYYEKAIKLNPGSENVKYNLSLANSRIIDKIETVPELFYIKWWKNISNRLSTDSWAKLGIIFFAVFWIAVFTFFFSKSIVFRKLSFWSGIIILMISGLSFLFAHQKYNLEAHQRQAILFTPTVTVKSSPNEHSVDLFVIHEGTKILITDRVEGWSEIRIADGSQGWLKDDTYRKI